MESNIKSEIQHKLIPSQIDSIDQEEFSMATNNLTPWKIEDIIQQGTYCCLLEGSSVMEKHPALKNASFEESNKYFNNKFKTGFAWEVLKVFSGPPKVVFSWRHWAHMGTENLTEEVDEGKGKLIELKGFTRASVSEEGKLKDIEVYFDQEKFLQDIDCNSKEYVEESSENNNNLKRNWFASLFSKKG